MSWRLGIVVPRPRHPGPSAEGESGKHFVTEASVREKISLGVPALPPLPRFVVCSSNLSEFWNQNPQSF